MVSTPAGVHEEGARDVGHEEIFDVLQNDRRRRVIDELCSHVGQATVRGLSERIAASETGESPPPRKARKSVYSSLVQTHLPKLDARGIVEYDPDRKTVVLDDGAEEAKLYLEVVSPYGITWMSYYRSVAVVSMLIIIATELNAPGVVAVPDLLWPVLFLLLVVASTARQLWSRRWLLLNRYLG
jgi:hypothetical protein